MQSLMYFCVNFQGLNPHELNIEYILVNLNGYLNVCEWSPLNYGYLTYIYISLEIHVIQCLGSRLKILMDFLRSIICVPIGPSRWSTFSLVPQILTSVLNCSFNRIQEHIQNLFCARSWRNIQETYDLSQVSECLG